MSRKQRF